MKKKSVSLLLTLTLVFSLFPAVSAEEAVTPTAPEWIKAEEYLIFPGDEVYEPENWAKVEAMRAGARNGEPLPKENQDWGVQGSVGTRYEKGLVRMKCAENTAAQGEGNYSYTFYLAAQAFRRAKEAWFEQNGMQYDQLYYKLLVEEFRAWSVDDVSYVTERASSLRSALKELGMTASEFWDVPYIELVPQEQREEVTLLVDAISIRVDGGTGLDLSVPPEVRNGRTMVPIRAVAEALGADVEWVQDTQQIVMTRAGVTVTMTLDSTTATIDDQTVEMDVAPYATDGRTLIPTRYVAEFFGQKVEWDGKRQEVLIQEDKSVTGVSNLEAWALPMGAMLSKMNDGSPACFGIYHRTAKNAGRCKGMLNGGSWNIPDRDDLAYTVLSMTMYGHDSTFREMTLDVKKRSQDEREAISNESDAWPYYMWEYTEYVDEKWGDRGIMAWDLFRMSNLVQWGYTAGYVTYAEALALLEPAATVLCKKFSSWDEAYENYLDGYNWWARNDVLGQDIWETSRGKTYIEMKADPAIGPIFDDALFETGVIGLPEE